MVVVSAGGVYPAGGVRTGATNSRGRRRGRIQPGQHRSGVVHEPVRQNQSNNREPGGAVGCGKAGGDSVSRKNQRCVVRVVRRTWRGSGTRAVRQRALWLLTVQPGIRKNQPWSSAKPALRRCGYAVETNR